MYSDIRSCRWLQTSKQRQKPPVFLKFWWLNGLNGNTVKIVTDTQTNTQTHARNTELFRPRRREQTQPHHTRHGDREGPHLDLHVWPNITPRTHASFQRCVAWRLGDDSDSDDACCGRWQILDVGSVDGLGVRSGGVHSDNVGGEMSRRAAHPHMNNLVYGRRSDPAAASYLDDDQLSAAVCRQVINRCARWQWQLDSESH